MRSVKVLVRSVLKESELSLAGCSESRLIISLSAVFRESDVDGVSFERRLERLELFGLREVGEEVEVAGTGIVAGDDGRLEAR